MKHERSNDHLTFMQKGNILSKVMKLQKERKKPGWTTKNVLFLPVYNMQFTVWIIWIGGEGRDEMILPRAIWCDEMAGGAVVGGGNIIILLVLSYPIWGVYDPTRGGGRNDILPSVIWCDEMAGSMDWWPAGGWEELDLFCKDGLALWTNDFNSENSWREKKMLKKDKGRFTKFSMHHMPQQFH